MITDEKMEWRDAWRPVKGYKPGRGMLMLRDDRGYVWRGEYRGGQFIDPKGEILNHNIVAWVYNPSSNIAAYYDSGICPAVPVEVMHAAVCKELSNLREENNTLKEKLKKAVDFNPEEKKAFQSSLAKANVQIDDLKKELKEAKKTNVEDLQVIVQERNSYKEQFEDCKKQLDDAQAMLELLRQCSYDYIIQLNNLFDGKESEPIRTEPITSTDLYHLRGKEIISERAMKRCFDLKCETLEDVSQHTAEEFMNLANCGEKTVEEISRILATFNLKLKI